MTENDVLVNHSSSFIDTTFTPHKYNNVYDIHQMETYREQTEIIGENEFEFDLCELPKFFMKYFNYDFKSTFNGNLKDLVRYFNDIFTMYNSNQNNQIVLCSKIYINQQM